ncbi:PhoH family protein [Candidatus Saccharibacteria bacterium]|nr:PhoH family protein [Candidatus Saccharibacteria bacterium]
MADDRPIYVIDTNVVVDYVDVVPSPGGTIVTHEDPTIDLSSAHIVIPTAVIRELSSFKKEKSDRGKAARTILRRVRKISEGKVRTMREVYELEAPIELENGSQTISILPVHKNFKKALPFAPSEDDMDGQIILAALTVAFLKAGLPVDGTADPEKVLDLAQQDIVLLTNDNGLAIRARERGVMTARYGYKLPEPYTGRRDVVVPPELFMEFYNYRYIEYAFWTMLMEDEPPLVTNEFIVMSLENPDDYPLDFAPGFFGNIGRYDAQENAIVPLKYVTDFPASIKNAGQAIYAEALTNPDFAAVVCTGPAGSGKTYMATVYGYEACKAGKFIGVTAVPCENHSNLGALPGDLEEKMDPDLQPLKNALRNYLLSNDSKLRKELECLQKFGTDWRGKKPGADPNDDAPEKKSIKIKLKDRVNMIWDNWFSSVPIDNARGRDFAHELAIYDEFQDQNISQADTLIKRIGNDGKIVLTGDIHQIHAPYLDEENNGLVYAARMLYDNPLVAQVCFTEDEVVRHPLVKAIAQRQKSIGKGVLEEI